MCVMIGAGATPRVSVVTPAYNAMATLESTVASVRNQTMVDWEMVIVDDGSTDGTRDLAEALAAVEPRITITGGGRAGVSAARNRGIALTRASVIAFLDADDLWAPEKLERQLAHLACRPRVGVSFSRARFLAPSGEPTGTVSTGRLDNLEAADLLYGNPTTTSSTLMVRREVLEKIGTFAESMSFAEDLEWLIRAQCLSHWRLEGLAEPLTDYRTSQGGLSSELERMREGWETMVRKVAVYAPAVVARHYRPAQAAQLRYLARRALRLGLPPSVALTYLREALASDWRIATRDTYGVAGTALAALSRFSRRANRQPPDTATERFRT